MNSVYERILVFNKDRLPDMVELKYAGMAENVYRFYRGTCHLFYEDFCKADHIPESPLTWNAATCIWKTTAATKAIIVWFILT
jgi:uncharacterized protein (DUF2252 family)